MTDGFKRMFDREKQIIKDAITLIQSSDDPLKRQLAFNTGLTAIGALRGYSDAFLINNVITLDEQYLEDRDRVALMFELYDVYYIPKVGDED